MLDLAAFAQQQQEIGKKAAFPTPQIVKLPGKADAYAIWDPSTNEFIHSDMMDGPYTLPSVGPRRYFAGTLESFCAMVNATTSSVSGVLDPAERQPPQEIGVQRAPCFIFVSMSKCVALISESDRRETITFPLTRSSSWNTLLGLRTGGGIKQAAVLDLLRRQLDATYEPGNIISTLRSIKFKSNEGGESTVGVGKATISKSIQAELTGADAVPEELAITAPIWDNVFSDGVPRTGRVLCCVDVNLSEQEFLIRPKAGQIEVHERDAQEWLVKQIDANTGENVRVFVGQPE